MLEHGFDPDFPPAVQQQIASLGAKPALPPPSGDVRDLRSLLWSSIDNDTSRDLDQIEVAEQLPNGDVKILIGIADVDADVPQASPIDQHASSQATTVYTGVRNFSMIPETLSTGLTSLLEDQDNAAVVTEFVVSSDGHVKSNDLYRALVHNHAQLTYSGVGTWLEGTAAAPPKVAASSDLQAQLKLQNTVAQALREQRYRHGALNIETIEVRPVVINDQIADVVRQEKNRATDLIEDFMIAANEVVARALAAESSIRRVVKTPERWERIVALAAAQGGNLPAQPDSKALNDFLMQRKAADPTHFADLSLAVIKLMGPGEYILERPGDPDVGHFGLAVQDYTHSTAPNRRFADLVTQRLVKSLLKKGSNPVLRQRSRQHCEKLHDSRRRRPQSRARDDQAYLGDRHEQPHRRSLRRHRDGCQHQGHVRARPEAARRRDAGAGRTGDGRRRQPESETGKNRRAKGLHRLREGVSKCGAGAPARVSIGAMPTKVCTARDPRIGLYQGVPSGTP